MLLRYVVLALDPAEFPGKDLAFDLASAYVSEYMARAVRAVRFKTVDFDQLHIEGRSSSAAKPVEVVAVNTLAVPVKFDEGAYRRSSARRRHEFYMSMLTAGMRKASRTHRLPMQALKAAIAAFRAGSYNNTWVHTKRRIPALGVIASLVCDLDPQRFLLHLEVSDGSRIIYRRAILRTKPTPYHYAHEFKNIVVGSRFLTVTTRFDDLRFRLPLSVLRRAKVQTTSKTSVASSLVQGSSSSEASPSRRRPGGGRGGLRRGRTGRP